jgi:tRNA dimethylallyltransferase
MMQHGLLTEAKVHANKELNALQTVGYRELFSYLNGNSAYNCCRRDQKKIQGALLSDKLPGSKR